MAATAPADAAAANRAGRAGRTQQLVLAAGFRKDKVIRGLFVLVLVFVLDALDFDYDYEDDDEDDEEVPRAANSFVFFVYPARDFSEFVVNLSP